MMFAVANAVINKTGCRLNASFIIDPGVGQAVAPPVGAGRKVRALQGRVPGNTWEARAYGKCRRKYTARIRVGKGEMVR